MSHKIKIGGGRENCLICQRKALALLHRAISVTGSVIKQKKYFLLSQSRNEMSGSGNQEMKAQGLRQHSNTLDNIKSSKNLNFLICDSIQIPFTFKLSSYLHFSSLETDSSGHMIIIILQSALKKRPCQYEDTCDMPKNLNIFQTSIIQHLTFQQFIHPVCLMAKGQIGNIAHQNILKF